MAQLAGVSFEVERLALEGGDLVVSGVWSGADRVRFVRPALLIADDRRILATLEHKPWAPSVDGMWTAAFPWTSDRAVEADSLVLSVGPQVRVPLGRAVSPAAAGAPKPAAAPKHAGARKPATAAKPAATPKPAAANRAARAPKPAPATAAAKAARAAKPKRPAAATAAPAGSTNGAPAAAPAVVPDDIRGFDLARSLAAAERDRDRALERLAEAVEAREAAEAARAAAAAQRDEALLAFRTLQRRLQSDRAQLDRAMRGETGADTPDDEPLGVRSVPAVRSVMAELQLPPREPKRRLTRFDLWVVRLLGLAAMACVFVLLYSILRVLL